MENATIVFNLMSDNLIFSHRSHTSGPVVFHGAHTNSLRFHLRRANTCSTDFQCGKGVMSTIRDLAIIKQHNRQLFALFEYYFGHSNVSSRTPFTAAHASVTLRSFATTVNPFVYTNRPFVFGLFDVVRVRRLCAHSVVSIYHTRLLLRSRAAAS